MALSYKKKLKVKRFQYDQDRDTLQRGIGVMIDLLQWGVWLLLAIACILFVALFGVSFYILAQAG